jgi:hypothetical protein
MCDITMLAFWTWAAAEWLVGVETGERRHLIVAVVLAAACALTKYNGITLVPLMLAYAVAHRGRIASSDALLAVPLVALAGWVALLAHQYGFESVQRSFSLASPVAIPRDWSQISARLATVLSFTGGCFISVLFYLPVVSSWRVAVLSIAGIGAAAWWISDIHGTALMLQGVDVSPAGRALQLCAFVATGLLLVVLAVTDLMRRRDAGAWFLGLSVVGTLLFAAFVAWSASARYLLPITPAAGILVARRLEQRAGAIRWRAQTLPLLPAMAVALAVAWGDTALANTSRSAAAAIYDRYSRSSATVWFQGHWGFQYYLQRHGAKPLDLGAPLAVVGDALVMPLNNTNLYEIDERFVQRSETFEWQPHSFVTTVSMAVGAGFYSDTFGPLPFVFGRSPAERYVVFTLGPRNAAQ